MTVKERKAIAHAISWQYPYDGRISDPDARGSAQRAISRMAQAMADTLNQTKGFDRKAFVEEMGFGHIEGF